MRNNSNLLIKLSLFASVMLSACNLFATGLSDPNNQLLASPNPFDVFDNQISIGNNWTFGTLNNGQIYQNNNISLDVSKLFTNGIYVDVGGSQAYNSTYVNYSGSDLYAALGYAFSIAPSFQVIPYAKLTRSQLSSFSNTSNLNDILYSGLGGVRLEYLPIEQLKLSVNSAYGLVAQNGTLDQSNGSTVYGGTFNMGAGISYQPVKNTPWLINADYGYNSYAGGLMSQNNQVTLSTGYSF